MGRARRGGRVRPLDRGDGVPLGREGRPARWRASRASASMSRGLRRASRLGSCRCSRPPSSRRSLRADEQTVVAAIAGEGPLTGPQLRDLTGLPQAGARPGRRRAAPQARRHERVSRRAGRAVGRDRTRPRRAQMGAACDPPRARGCAPPPHAARARPGGRAHRGRSRRAVRVAPARGSGAARQRLQEP